MTTIEKGDHVVISHPYMLDRHVVALVDKVTPNTCSLRYVTARGVAEDTNRRRIDHVVGVLPPGANPREVSQQLRDRGEALHRQEVAARRAYHAAVEAITRGQPITPPNAGDD